MVFVADKMLDAHFEEEEFVGEVVVVGLEYLFAELGRRYNCSMCSKGSEAVGMLWEGVNCEG